MASNNVRTRKVAQSGSLPRDSTPSPTYRSFLAGQQQQPPQQQPRTMPEQNAAAIPTSASTSTGTGPLTPGRSSLLRAGTQQPSPTTSTSSITSSIPGQGSPYHSGVHMNQQQQQQYSNQQYPSQPYPNQNQNSNQYQGGHQHSRSRDQNQNQNQSQNQNQHQDLMDLPPLPADYSPGLATYHLQHLNHNTPPAQMQSASHLYGPAIPQVPPGPQHSMSAPTIPQLHPAVQANPGPGQGGSPILAAQAQAQAAQGAGGQGQGQTQAQNQSQNQSQNQGQSQSQGAPMALAPRAMRVPPPSFLAQFAPGSHEESPLSASSGGGTMPGISQAAVQAQSQALLAQGQNGQQSQGGMFADLERMQGQNMTMPGLPHVSSMPNVPQISGLPGSGLTSSGSNPNMQSMQNLLTSPNMSSSNMPSSTSSSNSNPNPNTNPNSNANSNANSNSNPNSNSMSNSMPNIMSAVPIANMSFAQAQLAQMQMQAALPPVPGAGGVAYAGGAVSNKVSGGIDGKSGSGSGNVSGGSGGSGGGSGAPRKGSLSRPGSYDGGVSRKDSVGSHGSAGTVGTAGRDGDPRDGKDGREARDSREGASASPSHSTGARGSPTASYIRPGHSRDKSGSFSSGTGSASGPTVSSGLAQPLAGRTPPAVPIPASTAIASTGVLDSPPAIYGPPASAFEQPYRTGTPNYRATTPSSLRQSTLAESDSDEHAGAGLERSGISIGSAGTAVSGNSKREDRMLPFQEDPEELGESSSSTSTAQTAMHLSQAYGHGQTASNGSGGSGGRWSRPESREYGKPMSGGGKEYLTRTPQDLLKGEFRLGSPTPSSDVLPLEEKHMNSKTFRHSPGYPTHMYGQQQQQQQQYQQHLQQQQQRQMSMPLSQHPMSMPVQAHSRSATYEQDLREHGGRTSRTDYRDERDEDTEATLAEGDSDSDVPFTHQGWVRSELGSRVPSGSGSAGTSSNAQSREEMITPKSPPVGLPAMTGAAITKSPKMMTSGSPPAVSQGQGQGHNHRQSPPAAGPSDLIEGSSNTNAGNTGSGRYNQSTIRAKPRVSSGEQLGIRSFDPGMFEGTLDALRGQPGSGSGPIMGPQAQPQTQAQAQQAQDQRRDQEEKAQHQQQQQPAAQGHTRQRSYPPLEIPGRQQPIMAPVVNGNRTFFENPTLSSSEVGSGAYDYANVLANTGYAGTGSWSSYAPSHGTRPGAPVPPTPLSQTIAPSPSPMLSSASVANGQNQLPHPSLYPYSGGAFGAVQVQGVPPTASPYPFPYEHVRRGGPPYGPAGQPSVPISAPSPGYDLMNQMFALQAQLADQRRAYALNSIHAAAASETTLSPAGTPFPPEHGYEPWNYLRTSAVYAHPMDPRYGGGGPGGAPAGPGYGWGGGGSRMSLRSSPSHEPVPLPMAKRLRPRAARPGQSNTPNGKAQPGKPHPLRQAVANTIPRKAPPRVDSTQPRETSPELDESGSGEETPREGETGASAAPSQSGHHQSETSREGGDVNGVAHGETEGEGEEYATPADMSEVDGPQRRWVNSVHQAQHHMRSASEDDGYAAEGDWLWADEEEDEDEALEIEFHPSYVGAAEKRRKRWDTRWDGLVKAFQALDRETDSTLVLMAAPNHAGAPLHTLTSRSIRRDPSLLHSPALHIIRDEFGHVASQRAASRSAHFMPLSERLSSLAGSVNGDGLSDAGTSGEREEELKRMLQSALSSLGALGGIYEAREARWREEVRRQNEDRESVELLLRQSLGFGLLGSGTMGGVPTANLL